MNISPLRVLALPLAVAAAVVLPASVASAAPAENPYCDWRSGYGCEGYGYQYGEYPNDRDVEHYYRYEHRHHHRHWRY